MQVVAVAFEDVVLAYADLDVQVARWAAVGARLAVAGGADAHAVVDAGGDLYLQRLLLLDPALAVAAGAGLGNDLARAAAMRTGLLHAEKALAHLHRTCAVTGAAGLGAGAGLGTAAMAGVAAFPARDADLRLLAFGRFLQRNVHGIGQVVAAIDLAATACASAPAAEHVTEDVAEGLGKAAEALGATHAAAHVGVHAGVAVLVVGGAFLRVGQELVGLLDLLELLLGGLGGVTLVAVRVVLHGELAIGFLELVVRGVLGNAEDLVKISLGHGGLWGR